MQIAVFHNLPSGGGKRALWEMMKRLATNHEVDVYTLSCAEHEFCDLRPFVNQHIVYDFEPLPLLKRPLGRLNQAFRTIDLFRLKKLNQRVATEINRDNYDVAFIHHCQYGQSPSINLFLKPPTVYYCQEPPRFIYEPIVNRQHDEYSTLQKTINFFDPLPKIYRGIMRREDQKNTRAANLVLVNSAYSREVLYRVYGIFAHVCYLGVDTSLFQSQDYGKQNFVLTVGGLNLRKGFDFLIESLSHIPIDKRPELYIVSNFANLLEKTYIESLASQLGVTLQIHVHISDHRLVQLYNEALLTIYAPIMEPFGFVPLESMACGTPVIGVREAGIRESVEHKKSGLLVERDPSLFAQAIERLLDDPDKRQRYGQYGQELVRQKWTWEQTLTTLETYLSK